MAGINVGSVEVTVVPNAERFNATLKSQIVPQAEAIGRDAGDAIGQQIQERVRLALAGLPDAKINLDVDTTEATAQVERFAAKTGAQSMLIGGIIGAGLVAGGPLAIAGATALMGGIAAVIVRKTPEIQQAARGVTTAFRSSFTEAAQVTIPYFVRALDTVAASAASLADQAAPAFAALEWPIQSLADGVVGLARNTMPGLTGAVRDAGPVFEGLQQFLEKTGSGLGSMFSLIGQQGPAIGRVFSSLGDVLGGLLPPLGELIGQGAVLGSVVLPPLATVLGVVADVLGVVGPLLPGIALGFTAWKAAGALAPMLGNLAAGLETVGATAMVSVARLTGVQAAGMAAGTGFAAAATGARGLQAAMGPIGWIMAGISVVVPVLISAFSDQDGMQKKVKASAEAMTQALQQSKGAIDGNVRAVAAQRAQADGLLAYARTWGMSTSTIVDALTGNTGALDTVTAAAGRYQDGLAAQTQAAYQQVEGQRAAVTSYNSAALAAGTLGNANDKATAASKSQLKALVDLSRNTRAEVANQRQLKTAIDGATSAEEKNTTRLEGLSNTASAANSQINLLKGALDALTGKAVSATQAEIAVQQAVDGATTAVKDQSGALVDASGQLTVQTKRGAAAQQALIQLASASNQLIGTMEQQGATTGEVTRRDEQLRGQFVKTARQMGYTAGQAQLLADRIYGIPASRRTEIAVDTAAATRKAEALTSLLRSIRDRKVTVTVVGNVITEKVWGRIGTGVVAQASGGIVHAYAGGGVEPMRGGIAQIVPPKTYRLIGDRITDDEAYIPINSSARSLAIWQQAGRRMGALGAGSDLAPRPAAPAPVINQSFAVQGGTDAASLARLAARELAWTLR